MFRSAVFCFVIIICSTASVAQIPPPPFAVNGISYEQVIRMTQSGFSDEDIIAQIKRRPHPFKLSLDQVLDLKDAHVSNAVIEAMTSQSKPEVSAEPVQIAQPRIDARRAPPAASVTAFMATPASAPSTLPSQPVEPVRSTEPPAAPSVTSQAKRLNDGKIRVYVTDRPITEVISMMRGGYEGTSSASGSPYGFSASSQQAAYVGGMKNDNRGGADPRTLEVSGDILQECRTPNLTITNNPTLADYVMDFRRQGGKRSTLFIFGGLTGLAISSNMKVDHAALYAANGDLITVAKARTVGGAVREVCSHFH